ncbi:MAG: endonuclease [Verrucomicrobiota bacterium]
MGKTGVVLQQALHEIINDHTNLPYSSSGTNNTEEALKRLDVDPANTNNVILLYEQRSEPKNTFGLTTGWNREHQWPDSYGLDDIRPSFTDLFNLRAEDANVNSARGNKFYDISDTNSPGYKKPAHIEAPVTSTDSDSWEPPNSVKGDIARALFYMDVRYEGDRTNEQNLVLKDITTGINSSTNLMGRLSTLLYWSEQDPVDDAERLRNDLIYRMYQHNRNPFIDHPEWIQIIFEPALRIVMNGPSVQVYWPADFTNAVLMVSENVSGPWMPGAGTKTSSGEEVVQSETATNQTLFFRLKLR